MIDEYEDGLYVGTRIVFTHPNKDMLRNQIGAFLCLFLMEATVTSNEGLDALIETKTDEFLAILEGKRAF